MHREPADVSAVTVHQDVRTVLVVNLPNLAPVRPAQDVGREPVTRHPSHRGGVLVIVPGEHFPLVRRARDGLGPRRRRERRGGPPKHRAVAAAADDGFFIRPEFDAPDAARDEVAAAQRGDQRPATVRLKQSRRVKPLTDRGREQQNRP